MNIEEFREYCLAKPGAFEDFPFGPDTLVFKVVSKMFALTGLDSDRFTANLKCDPDRVVELREQYPEVQPGFHMNKTHWNTVDFEGSLPESLLRELVDLSYEMAKKSLTKKEREALSQLD